ncbi:ATP-binding protein [Streptomyces mirabilis]|uniref:ATP-binding protein n=1 Tax=Streptomyces mirabilis TaxID=68239 RepID=UPI003678BDDF
MYATEAGLTSPTSGGSVGDLSGAGAAGTSQERGAPVGIPAPLKPLDDATWRLAHCPQAARTAREITASILDDWHAGEGMTEAALLVVSELVTNAVEHAQPPVALHLHRERAGNQVWMGVSDGGPVAGEGAWTASCTNDEHGRGLDIIDALTTAHGIRSHPGGTTHWARLQTTTT